MCRLLSGPIVVCLLSSHVSSFLVYVSVVSCEVEVGLHQLMERSDLLCRLVDEEKFRLVSAGLHTEV